MVSHWSALFDGRLRRLTTSVVGTLSLEEQLNPAGPPKPHLVPIVQLEAVRLLTGVSEAGIEVSALTIVPVRVDLWPWAKVVAYKPDMEDLWSGFMHDVQGLPKNRTFIFTLVQCDRLSYISRHAIESDVAIPAVPNLESIDWVAFLRTGITVHR